MVQCSSTFSVLVDALQRLPSKLRGSTFLTSIGNRTPNALDSMNFIVLLRVLFDDYWEHSHPELTKRERIKVLAAPIGKEIRDRFKNLDDCTSKSEIENEVLTIADFIEDEILKSDDEIEGKSERKTSFNCLATQVGRETVTKHELSGQKESICRPRKSMSSTVNGTYLADNWVKLPPHIRETIVTIIDAALVGDETTT